MFRRLSSSGQGCNSVTSPTQNGNSKSANPPSPSMIIFFPKEKYSSRLPFIKIYVLCWKAIILVWNIITWSTSILNTIIIIYWRCAKTFYFRAVDMDVRNPQKMFKYVTYLIELTENLKDIERSTWN